MKINLYDILNHYNGSSLQLKMFLLKMKKEGVLFYPGKITTLSFERTFDFYLAYSKGKRKNYNAFPIPASVFFNNRKLNKKSISQFYYQYYNTPFPTEFYKSLKVFKGSKFVWLYH